MPIYVEFSDVSRFVTTIQQNGVYESLMAIMNTADQKIAENFNIPAAIIKTGQAHDGVALNKQDKLFCSWALDIVTTLMHAESIDFASAVWEGDVDGVEGLKAYFTLVGSDVKPTLRLAGTKMDVEKFYMSLMQCKMFMKPKMFHKDLDSSLAILGLPPLPKVIRNPEADEKAYFDMLDEVQALSNSPVPHAQQHGYDV